jgi:hypothetical protein
MPWSTSMLLVNTMSCHLECPSFFPSPRHLTTHRWVQPQPSCSFLALNFPDVNTSQFSTELHVRMSFLSRPKCIHSASTRSDTIWKRPHPHLHLQPLEEIWGCQKSQAVLSHTSSVPDLPRSYNEMNNDKNVYKLSSQDEADSKVWNGKLWNHISKLHYSSITKQKTSLAIQ